MIQKPGFIALFILIPLTAVLRVTQLMYMIDPDTLFYKSQYAGVGAVFGVCLFAAAVLLILLGRTGGGCEPKAPEKSGALAVLSLLMGVGVAVQAALTINAYAGDNSGSGDPLASVILLTLLAAGSLWYFLREAYACRGGGRPGAMVALCPALYFMVQLVTLFVRYTGIANISESMFDMGLYVLLMLFFLLRARVGSDIGRERAMRWLFGFGFACALFCCLTTVPRYAVLLWGDRTVLHGSDAPSPFVLLTGVYIIVYLCGMARRPSRCDHAQEAL